MNYDHPSRRQADQRWDMTSMNDRRVHPIGYCAGPERANPRKWTSWDLMYPAVEYREAAKAREIARYDAHADRYHANGHATDVEASDCYLDYRLDHDVCVGTGTPPSVCEADDANRRARPERFGDCDERGPALTYAVVHLGEWRIARLCPAHQTREVYERLLGPRGTIHTSVHS